MTEGTEVHDENDFDAMFDAEPETEPVETAETPEEPAIAETDGGADDDTAQDAQTAPVEAKTDEGGATTPATEPETPSQDATVQADAEPNGAMIPQHAFAAMREDLKGQIASLQAELQQVRAQPQPQAAQDAPTPTQPEIPDPILDPQGYRDWQEGVVSETLFRDRMEVAYNAAKATGRDEAEMVRLGTAFGHAAQANPGLAQQLRSSPDPIAFIDSWHKRQETMRELDAHGGDLDALIAARQAAAQQMTPQAQPQARPATAQPAAQGQPAIPQSIVTARPATVVPGVTVEPDPNDFDAVFG